MREVARWQSWPKEGESETENHESAELQSDQIKEMSKTSKAAKRQAQSNLCTHGSATGVGVVLLQEPRADMVLGKSYLVVGFWLRNLQIT
jgi:hypothetical protein